MTLVDARGHNCPYPVIMTKKAVDEGLPVTVLVDDMAPVKNITRFAASMGLSMEYSENAEGYYEIILRHQSPQP